MRMRDAGPRPGPGSSRTGGAAILGSDGAAARDRGLGAGWSAAPGRHRCRGTRPTTPVTATSAATPAARTLVRRELFRKTASRRGICAWPTRVTIRAKAASRSADRRAATEATPTAGVSLRRPPRRRASAFARRPPRTPPPTRARRPAAVPHQRAGAGKFPAQPAEEGPDRRTASVRRAGPARRGRGREEPLLELVPGGVLGPFGVACHVGVRAGIAPRFIRRPVKK